MLATILLAPIRALWSAYAAVWWAFDEAPARHRPERAPVLPDQSRSFEVVDSRPTPATLPRPLGALRAGFVVTALTSGIAGAALASGSTPESGSTPWIAWGWITGLAAVGTVWLARWSAIRRVDRARRGPIKSVRDRAASLGRTARSKASACIHRVCFGSGDAAAGAPGVPGAAPGAAPGAKERSFASAARGVGRAAVKSAREAATTIREAWRDRAQPEPSPARSDQRTAPAA